MLMALDSIEALTRKAMSPSKFEDGEVKSRMNCNESIFEQ